MYGIGRLPYSCTIFYMLKGTSFFVSVETTMGRQKLCVCLCCLSVALMFDGKGVKRV